jgi:O-antigen ligase
MQLTKRIPEVSSSNTQHNTRKRLKQSFIVVIGITLGIVVAFLISRDAWQYASIIIALIPLALLIVSRPFTGIIIWLLLMPFVSIAPNSEAVYWAIYRLLTPVILALAVISRWLNVRKQQPARIGPPELAMGTLAFIVPISILLSQSNSIQVLFVYYDRILVPFCMYLAIRLLAPRDRELHLLQWTALFVLISQALIGILSWFTPGILPTTWLKLQGARTTGSLGDPNLFATVVAFCTVLLIQSAMHCKSQIIRLIFFVAGGVGFICIFLSLERAAWIAGIFVVFGLIFLFPKAMLRLAFIGLIIMAILGTSVLSTHVKLSVDRLSDPGPVYDRIVVTDALLQMIQLKPVFGWGYESLNQNISDFYRRVGEAAITRNVITSHNTYLTILTELGLVGFLLYIFPVVWWFILSVRVWKRMPKDGLWSRSFLAILWLSMLFDFTISNFMDMRWFPIGITLWWMTLGLIANMVYPYLKGRQGISQESKLLVRFQEWTGTSV